MSSVEKLGSISYAFSQCGNALESKEFNGKLKYKISDRAIKILVNSVSTTLGTKGMNNLEKVLDETNVMVKAIVTKSEDESMGVKSKLTELKKAVDNLRRALDSQYETDEEKGKETSFDLNTKALVLGATIQSKIRNLGTTTAVVTINETIDSISRKIDGIRSSETKKNHGEISLKIFLLCFEHLNSSDNINPRLMNVFKGVLAPLKFRKHEKLKNSVFRIKEEMSFHEIIDKTIKSLNSNYQGENKENTLETLSQFRIVIDSLVTSAPWELVLMEGYLVKIDQQTVKGNQGDLRRLIAVIDSIKGVISNLDSAKSVNKIW